MKQSHGFSVTSLDRHGPSGLVMTDDHIIYNRPKISVLLCPNLLEASYELCLLGRIPGLIRDSE
jgi:hypothetical protein